MIRRRCSEVPESHLSRQTLKPFESK